MFDAAGGFDAFMRDSCVVVTSDHGHCEVRGDREQSAVHLDRVLGDFKQAQLGKPWRPGDEIMICPNMRAAQIYLRGGAAARVTEIARLALGSGGVDQVIWRRSLVTPGAPGYAVHSTRGRLEFWRARPDSGDAEDAFGNIWAWRGDLEAFRMERDGGRVASEVYPNAFERVSGALDAASSGDVWITAQPGCEFELPGGKAHAGGASHGALHALDSLSPAIAAGFGRPLPRHMRSVDVAPLCLEALGLSMPRHPDPLVAHRR
jgi:hypothetical protein